MNYSAPPRARGCGGMEGRQEMDEKIAAGEDRKHFGDGHQH